MRYSVLVAALLQGAAAQRNGQLPAKGDGTFAGGIYGISLTDLAGVIAKQGMGQFTGLGPESPKGASPGARQKGPGSGKYPAKMITDPSLPRHTIYVPQTPPPVKMPVIAWGNGACGMDGSGFYNFLIEIASHGYLVIADGPPGKGGSSSSSGGSGGFMGKLGGGGGGQSKVSDMRDSIDWALAGKASKYGNIDPEKVGAAGQSCGGHESYSTSYRDPRIKLTTLFNMGIYQDEKRYLLKELKAPVGYFIGGTKDTGYINAEKDYPLLPQGLPAYKASLDTGHLGTYFTTNGGKSGKAAVNWFEYNFRGDPKAKEYLFGKGPGTIVGDRWNVTYKNWS